MRLTCLTVAAMLAPVFAAAQQFMPDFGLPVDPDTRFEVVSIKPLNTEGGSILMRIAPGHFESSVPVGVLLRQALQKADYQIAGAPGWVDTTRYSIRATVPEGVPPGALSVMLHNLLRDRFQLATRNETREQAIFHLVPARADGRLGPDLRTTPAECQGIIAERVAAARAVAAGRGSPPTLQAFPGTNEPLPCGFSRTPPGLVAASGRALAELARTLSDITGRQVIDKTGLTGLYDFTLKYASDGRVTGLLALLSPGPVGTAPPVDPDAPALFVALQEQLGLRLASARGPVDVVVIERIERPALE